MPTESEDGKMAEALRERAEYISQVDPIDRDEATAALLRQAASRIERLEGALREIQATYLSRLGANMICERMNEIARAALSAAFKALSEQSP